VEGPGKQAFKRLLADPTVRARAAEGNLTLDVQGARRPRPIRQKANGTGSTGLLFNRPMFVSGPDETADDGGAPVVLEVSRDARDLSVTVVPPVAPGSSANSVAMMDAVPKAPTNYVSLSELELQEAGAIVNVIFINDPTRQPQPGQRSPRKQSPTKGRRGKSNQNGRNAAADLVSRPPCIS
jgi:hypothetical protein